MDEKITNGMNDLEQDRAYDSMCDQIAAVTLSFTILPLLAKVEPRLWVRFRTKLDAMKKARDAINNAITEMEKTDA